MPVRRYKSVGDVPDPPQVPLEERAARIAALWAARPDGLSPYPAGVTRFRSVNEAQAAREAYETARARELARQRAENR